MNPLQDVRIVQLPPLRVASAHGFGEGPEELAWNQMTAWLKAKGIWQAAPAGEQRFFGFNNPSPSGGSPNYGYEVWATVGAEVVSEGAITVKEVPGGLYAVTRCVVANPYVDIPHTWKQLSAWVEASTYRPAHHQWLEETFWDNDPNFQTFVLDLFMPVQ